jgi:UDPglucose 6-dehydrogenase
MANITVVGSGVVGTATGRGLLAHGHSVTFVDVSPDRVEALRAEGLDASPTVDLTGPERFVFLTVPTPSGPTGYDLSVLSAAVGDVGSALRAATAVHTVVVRSTVPPGTCESMVRRGLEDASGMVAGEGFLVASNPEFLRAASALDDFLEPWMTVVGSRSQRAREGLVDLLSPFGGELRCFDDPAPAELVKCAHNLYNAAKISFWNEIWQVSRHLGIDADAVAATVARSAEGSTNIEYGIRGGAPFGGACLPKDTAGFLGFARDLGFDMKLLAAVMAVNGDMEQLVGAEISEAERALDDDGAGAVQQSA